MPMMYERHFLTVTDVDANLTRAALLITEALTPCSQKEPIYFLLPLGHLEAIF